MEITVNVEKIDLAEHISSHYDEDGDRVPSGTLADVITHQLVTQFAKSDSYRGLAERVQTIRDEEIRAALAPLITEALEKPFARTNAYGEPTGQSTTLREVVVEQAKSYLAERDGYGGRDNPTRLQKAIREQVEAAFKAEVAQAVKDVREAVAKQFGGSVTDAVTAAVHEAMRARP